MYNHWEAIDRSDGEIGIICPACVTGAEQQDMDEDTMEAAEVLPQCARCGREAPDFNTGNPAKASYGDPETHGWYIVGDTLVCAACATVEEMQSPGDTLMDETHSDRSKRAPVSSTDAMLWLNDWCGRHVFVTVTTDHSGTFFSAEGELRHRTETGTGGHPETDMGRYHVGESADFNISDPDLPAARFSLADERDFFGLPTPFEETLLIVLGSHVDIRVARLKGGE